MWVGSWVAVGPPRFLGVRMHLLQSSEAWGALVWAQGARPKVRAGRRPGSSKQVARGSEVAEDLTLPVPVHLRCPLVDPGGSCLLLGLSRRGAQVEATLLERVVLPGAAILGAGRWPE